MKDLENEKQAIEYLLCVSLKWDKWETHHRRLMQAIRIILNKLMGEGGNDKRRD